MSFLVKQPALPQSALTDQEPRSSYSEAQTIPLGFGQNFFASQWISQAYNRRTAPAGQNQPEHQYASIAAKFRRGPIVYVGCVKRDGKIIQNLDYTFGPSEDEHTFTIQAGMKGGLNWQLVLRRGTATQSYSAALRTATGQQHPPYKGDVWAEWINIPLGQGMTAIPDLQLELRAEVPEIGAFGGGVHPFHGVNAIAAIYAIAKEAAGGLGAPDSIFDETHYGAQSVALETNGVGGRTGSLTGIHPIITAPRSAGAFFSDILSYFDGYLYAEGGQLKIGWFPNQPATPTAEITEADLTDKPGGNGFEDWNRAPVSASVVFTEQGRYYLRSAATSNAPANAETGPLATPVRKDRPWIHTFEQAVIIADEIANSDGNDDSGVSLPVMTSRLDAASAVPGALINWDYAPHALDLACRVISRRSRAGQASETITIIRDRGAWPAGYVAPVDERVAPAADEPGTVIAADVRLWLVPEGLRANADEREIAVLINRGKTTINAASIALSVDGAEPWATVLQQNFWAAKCAVAVGINASAATLQLTSTSVDFAAMEASNAVEQSDDTLLAIVDNELLSVGTITAAGANTFDLGILRGRRGSTAAAHTAGAAVWLVRRSELQTIAHAEFGIIAVGGAYSATVATKHFKVALSTADGPGAFAPADPGLSITIPDPTPGTISDLTATLATGRSLKLTWSAVSGAEEYKVFHNTSNDSGTADELGEVGSPEFTHFGVVPGEHFYWVKPVSKGNLVGAFSNAATCTVVDVVEEQGVDPTLPPNPAAPTLVSPNGSGTKTADDGTVSAWLKFTLPALTGNAVGFNLYYWTDSIDAKVLADQIGEERRAASAVFGIDDLPSGTSVHVGLEQYSAYGYCSESIIEATGSPFTTATAPAPAAPSGLAVSIADADLARIPPLYAPGTRVKYMAGLLTWTASTSKDVAYYEIWRSAGTPSKIGRTKGTETEFAVYAATMVNPATDDILVYTVSRSRVSSATAATLAQPDYDLSANYGSGSMAEQNSTAISVTGGSLTGLTAVGSTSARRFKKNIRRLRGKDAIALMMLIHSVRFDWRDGHLDGDFGHIADELAKIAPQVVYRDAAGRVSSVDYGKLSSVYAACVQELVRHSRRHERRLDDLTRRLARIERSLGRN